MASVDGARPISRPHLPPCEISLETENGGLMTACTQPGCTGTIVDDYCNVCGSPAGAPPFVPAGAAASAPSAALAVGSGLTAGRQRPEFPPPPQSGGFMTACTQPGCTGTIVDDYCNVCGSPAGSPPFVPAGAAASAPPAALAVGTGLTAGRRGVLAAVRRGVGVAVVIVLTRLRRRLLPSSARRSYLRLRPDHNGQNGPDQGRHTERDPWRTVVERRSVTSIRP